MKNWEVYFEIYGKKMKTTIMAESEIKAVEEVRKKLTIHKVVKKKDAFNDAIDMLDNFLNPKKK